MSLSIIDADKKGCSLCTRSADDPLYLVSCSGGYGFTHETWACRMCMIKAEDGSYLQKKRDGLYREAFRNTRMPDWTIGVDLNMGREVSAIGVEWHEGDGGEAEPHAIGYRDYYRIHRHGDPVVDGQTIMDYLDYLAKRVSEL